MTDHLTYLDEVDARVEAATEGPWEAGDVWVFTDPVYPDDNRLSDVLGMKFADEDRAEAERERGLTNAEFIAHARQDLPALSKALRAVLAIHPREVIAVHEGYGEEAWCPRCQEHYPCPTVQAIQAALAVSDEGESND